MPRNSFARTVARAAASGGSKNYRGRRPLAWYALITVIVIVGVGLTIYSHDEKNRTTKKAAEGPTATDHWDVALGIDLCGSMQPDLAASTNLTTYGLRTYGNGLIDIEPGVVTDSSDYEGKNANLGVFAKGYSGFDLTNSSITVPGKLPLSNGATCSGPLHGTGSLVAQTWSSPTASPVLVTKDITSIHLNNDEMITLAFVPKGATIPEPSSKGTLITTVAANAKLGPIATTTTTTASATTTTTASATSTTTSSPTTSSTSAVPSESPTTTASPTTSTTKS